MTWVVFALPVLFPGLRHPLDFLLPKFMCLFSLSSVPILCRSSSRRTFCLPLLLFFKRTWYSSFRLQFCTACRSDLPMSLVTCFLSKWLFRSMQLRTWRPWYGLTILSRLTMVSHTGPCWWTCRVYGFCANISVTSGRFVIPCKFWDGFWSQGHSCNWIIGWQLMVSLLFHWHPRSKSGQILWIFLEIHVSR